MYRIDDTKKLNVTCSAIIESEGLIIHKEGI
jgi:hypothetical protein